MASPSRDSFDVVIAGGGPAGLATSIATAQQGLSVLVLERRTVPHDKPCGEGVMPPGIAALEQLGVRQMLDPARCRRLRGVRFIQEDGSFAEASLSGDGLLGVRRTALVEALRIRALQCGAQIRDRCEVLGYSVDLEQVRVATQLGEIRGKVLIIANGLGSLLGEVSGRRLPTSRRFGMRRHFMVRPWSDFVEVHLSDGVEAYITPVGPESVGIAFLWDSHAVTGKMSYDSMLARFPLVANRVRSSSRISEVRGAGPMLRRPRARVADRVAIVGDAGGYVDAITGEGLSLAFRSALRLSRILPEAIRCGTTRDSMIEYERGTRRDYRRYAVLAHAVLAIARHPHFRRYVVNILGRSPATFTALLKLAVA